MVSMSYSQRYFPSVCSPEHSAFQVSFHDYSGLGPLFYFWYEIDLVSCWLLCTFMQISSVGLDHGDLLKQQNVHYGRIVVQDSLRVWSSYNMDFWEHQGQMLSVRQQVLIWEAPLYASFLQTKPAAGNLKRKSTYLRNMSVENFPTGSLL